MRKPPLDPDVADLAPSDPARTRYDDEHLVTYLHMLDANADGADCGIGLTLSPEFEASRSVSLSEPTGFGD
jgi:hypothetical protein